MNPQSPEREALPARDRRWVAALKAHGPDGPPPALDAAVLAAARAAVGAPAGTSVPASTGRSARPPRWLAAVAGVMVVLSAGVLVRQVAQETAPREPSIAVPSAAERRAESARAATQDAEGAAVAEDQAVERMEPAVVTGSRIRPEPPGTSGAIPDPFAAAESAPAAAFAPSAVPASPPPAAALAPRLQAAPKAFVPPPPAEPTAVDAAAARADAAPILMEAPAAPEPAPAPVLQAEAAPGESRQKAEVGQSAAKSAGGAGMALPEPEVLAEARRLLAAGERDAARDLLIDWRQRHPGVALPAELEGLMERESTGPGGSGG